MISQRPRSLINAESLRTKLPRGFNREKGMIGNEALLKITHGWLVGFDAGEFGGGLWFVDSVGQSHKLTGENVHGLMSTPQGTLVFVGLSHLGLDTGKVLLVDDSSGVVPTVRSLLDLDGAPKAITPVSARSAIVVTTQGVSEVNSSGGSQTLIYRVFLSLDPNSVASTSQGAVYIGMRMFVVRLEPESGHYTEQWLVPTECAHFERKDYDCVCQK